MTTNESHRLIVVSLVGGIAVTTLSRIFDGKIPKPHDFIAAGFAYVVIGLFAEIAPEVAGAVAILFFLTTILENGSSLFSNISSVFNAGR